MLAHRDRHEWMVDGLWTEQPCRYDGNTVGAAECVGSGGDDGCIEKVIAELVAQPREAAGVVVVHTDALRVRA